MPESSVPIKGKWEKLIKTGFPKTEMLELIKIDILGPLLNPETSNQQILAAEDRFYTRFKEIPTAKATEIGLIEIILESKV